MVPLAKFQVYLTQKGSDPNSCYINASLIPARILPRSSQTYIAAQAPLPCTMEDWWRMVWEQKCELIVMLTQLEEGGVVKAARFHS